MNNLKFSLLTSLTFLSVLFKAAAPVFAVPITGFTGAYGSTHWQQYADDGSGVSVPIDAPDIGVTQVIDNTSTPPADNSSMDIDLNCLGANPTTSCPYGSTYSITAGSYIEQYIPITSSMSGIVSFDWTFDYADANVIAGVVLLAPGDPGYPTGPAFPPLLQNSTFTPFVSGQNVIAPLNCLSDGMGGCLTDLNTAVIGEQNSGVPVELTVNAGDVLAIVVESVVNVVDGVTPPQYTSYGALHVYNFKVKDIPFEFNPIQGFALGLPLFLGLRMLKKHRSGHKQ